MSKEVADTQITKSERTELRRITKARFDLLEEQLKIRMAEVKNRLREEIQREFKAEIKAAERKRLAFLKKYDALIAEGDALQKEFKRSGVAAATGRADEIYVGPKSGNRRYEHRDGDYETRFSVQSYGLLYHYGRDEHSNCVVVYDLDVKVNERVKEILEQANYAKLNLRQTRLEIEEELAVGAIESTGGKAFLDKIPTIDTLIPLDVVEEAKALKAGR